METQTQTETQTPNWVRYEKQVRDHLVNTGECNEAWLWSDIPEQELLNAKLINSCEQQRLKRNRSKSTKINSLQDLGIDVLGKNNHGYILVQAKNYTDCSVTPEKLACFFMYMLMSKLKDHQFRLYYTSRLSHVINDKVVENEFVERLTYQKLPLIDCNANLSASISLSSEIDLPLRDYQLTAVQQLENYFQVDPVIIDDTAFDDPEESKISSENSESDRRIAGILSMPGGTGKTVVFAKFASTHFKSCVILSPTRVLAEQNLKRMQSFYPTDSLVQLIDSDGCRDREWLTNLIIAAQKNGKSIVISATYHSCDVVNEVIVELLTSQPNCLVVVDEFHDIPKTAILDGNHQLGLVLRKSRRVLFVSATPRCYALENDDQSNSTEASQTSAIEYLFGEKIYELSFHEAVTNNYICDYQLWLPSIWEKSEIDSQLEAVGKDLKLTLTSSSFSEIEQNRYLKATVLLNWMLQNGLRRTIVYVLPSIDSDSTDEVKSAENECQLLSEILVKVAEEYHGINLNCMTILGKTSQSNRREYLTSFGEDNNETFKVLLNCRVLDEGVDLPNCDSIFIAYGAKDKVRNIQRLYRCLRRYGNKRKGHCLFWGDDEDRTVKFLSSIREIDPEFKSKLKIQSTDYNERTVDVSETVSKSTRNLDKIDNLVVKAIPYQDFLKMRNDILVLFLRKYRRIPEQSETYNYHGKLIKVGQIYSNFKASGKNKVLLLKLMEEFVFVKNDIEGHQLKIQTTENIPVIEKIASCVRQDSLQSHKRTTRNFPYTCPRCGYETIKKNSMNRHLNEKKTPCPASLLKVDLTEDIKNEILENRIYRPPVSDSRQQKILGQIKKLVKVMA